MCVLGGDETLVPGLALICPGELSDTSQKSSGCCGPVPGRFRCLSTAMPGFPWGGVPEAGRTEVLTARAKGHPPQAFLLFWRRGYGYECGWDIRLRDVFHFQGLFLGGVFDQDEREWLISFFLLEKVLQKTDAILYGTEIPAKIIMRSF